MSTRARIAFIVREEGYRLEYSKHWDGYPWAVLGSLPAGTFTIEDLIKRWGLTEELEGFTEYYYEFDFRNMTLKIWGADMSEIPWKQGELIFDGTIEEAYRKYYLDAPEPQMPNRAVVMTHLSNPTFAEFDKQKLSLRSQDILLDTQAAHIYGVSVTEVRRAASRNKERFPADSAFRLTRDEIKSLPDELRNDLHFEKNHYLPYAFTETGFSMLATLLPSEIAVKANHDIISAVSATNSIQSLMQKFFETMKDSDPKKPF